MTVKQAAERLEVSVATVYSLITAGRLRHYRIGNGRGVIRIGEDHIAAYLNGAESVIKTPVPSHAPRLKHIRLT